MKPFLLAVLLGCLVGLPAMAAEPVSAATAPVEKPAQPEPPVAFLPLEHYAPLWERSVFTTKDLPSPDAPTGPIFSDSLSLSGIYEVDGQVVAVLVDRTTSQISEARMEVENDAGIKIRKITPGASMDKTRVQLQKGDQAGWVSFSDAPAPSAAPAASAGLDTRRPPAPGQPPAMGGLSSPLLPPPAQAGGALNAPTDVPLPPP